MKNEKYFNKILEDTVNINKTRKEKLDKKIKILDEYLKENFPHYVKKENQGSYAMKTIIKPPKSKVFDADIMIYAEDIGKDAEFYMNALYDLFRNNDNYKDIVDKKSRCIRIDYADDFHIDIVICVEKKDGKKYICNRNTNEFEQTDGTEYKMWLTDKNKKSDNYLKSVTKLMKYLRDIKTNFTCKSILLTTLLGENVDKKYDSIPEALKIIMNNLNSFLQSNSNMPTVLNPVLDEEDFNRHWDQNKYSNFRDKIKLYTEKINDAYIEKDEEKSIKKWREIFGDCFAKDYEENSDNRSNNFSTLANKPYYYE